MFHRIRGPAQCLPELVGHHVATIHFFGLCGPWELGEVHPAGLGGNHLGLLEAGQ